MKPVKQTLLHAPERGDHGNCMSAVLASLLHVDIERVPVFSHPEHWQRQLNGWLRPFGLAYIQIEGGAEYVSRTGIEGLWHEACGTTQRSSETLHAVVARDGVPLFDPHPDNTGIHGAQAAGLFVVLEPWRWDGFEAARSAFLDVCDAVLNKPGKPANGPTDPNGWHAGHDAAYRAMHTVAQCMQPAGDATRTVLLRANLVAARRWRDLTLDLLRSACDELDLGLDRGALRDECEARVDALVRDIKRLISDMDTLRAQEVAP
jgi:hypothetical protein